jgi:death-on-curing protein
VSDVLIIGVEDIRWFHDYIIEHYGGHPGVRDEHSLRSAAQRPHSGFGSVELFPTLFDKAAALAHGRATAHPFIDGNKRTALFTAAAILYLNGYSIDAQPFETEETMVAVALHEMSVQQLAQWLRARSRRLTPDDTAQRDARHP